MENFNDIGISCKLDLKRIEKLLKIGIFASILVFIGDWILGYGVCDESLTGLEGKLSQYKTLSDTALFVSAFLGLIGIPLEGLCYFGIYRLMSEMSPHYAHMYHSGIIGYLIFGGCGVHVPCLAAVYVYNHIGYNGALKFIEYFLIPATVLFFIFFAVMSYAQIAAFAKGFTPLPKWCWIFSLPVGMAAAILFKIAGNLAFANAVTAAWIKDIGSRNRLLMSYSLAAVFIAMNRRTALSTEENFSILDNTIRNSGIIKTFVGNADGYLSEKRLPVLIRWENETKKSPYENDWEVTILKGNGEYDLGYDYTKCGVCRLCADEGCPELAAYNCRLDYTLAEMIGLKLKRTTTIADGGAKCDFRYSRK